MPGDDLVDVVVGLGGLELLNEPLQHGELPGDVDRLDHHVARLPAAGKAE